MTKPRIALTLFGAPVLRVDGATATLASPRVFAVLGHLALAAQPLERRGLAERVRPDLDREAGLADLRRQLYYLDVGLAARGAGSFVQRRGKLLELDPDVREAIDVVRFERHAAEGRLEEAASLYGGDLLGSVDDEVIGAARDRLRARMEGIAEQLVARCRTEGRRDDAIGWAEQLRRLDPYRESNVRALMRLRAGAGDRTGALRTYREFAALIERELGLTPLPSTRVLARKLGRSPTAGDDAARLRHMRRYLARAGKLGAKLGDTRWAHAYPRLVRDADEIRSALRTAIVEGRDVAGGTAVCIALQQLWIDRGLLKEVSALLERALADPTLPAHLRAGALRTAAVLARRQGAPERAISLGREAVEAFDRLGDPAGTGRALVALGNAYVMLGEPASAIALSDRGFALAKRMHSAQAEAMVTLMVAQAELSIGDLGGANARFRTAIGLCETAGLASEMLIALNNLATCALFEDALDDAEQYAAESLRRGRELALPVHVAWALSALASVAWRRGDVTRALERSDEVADTARSVHLPVLIVRLLEDIAAYFSATARPRDAAFLLGSADAARAQRALPLLPVERDARAACVNAIVGAIGDAGFVAARTAGATVQPDDVLGAARAAVATGSPL